ncbi:R3H domain-containing nucleic acid-binding protein [Adlercreutzia sp. ZJ154]|uniref:Jag family protein n=1 Tax=Adlercreutzia sp. ZJ154 TaxID=2709790 RepID=UPI0013EE1148|nr:R3H domain-containing nucleic acid-binding protein [Adlercreutzia sp. ZJ154]
MTEEQEFNIEDDIQSEVSEEELDEIADKSITILQNILKHFNIGEVVIDEYEGDEGELILDITGNDLAVMIGRHGNTLDALQTLFNSIIIRELGYRYPIVIDVEGYKGRQRQKLESIARSSASRAVTQHRNVSLHPMTPYERRIIHVTLKDNNKVTTISEGEGNTRHVIVIPNSN